MFQPNGQHRRQHTYNGAQREIIFSMCDNTPQQQNATESVITPFSPNVIICRLMVKQSIVPNGHQKFWPNGQKSS